MSTESPFEFGDLYDFEQMVFIDFFLLGEYCLSEMYRLFSVSDANPNQQIWIQCQMTLKGEIVCYIGCIIGQFYSIFAFDLIPKSNIFT